MVVLALLALLLEVAPPVDRVVVLPPAAVQPPRSAQSEAVFAHAVNGPTAATAQDVRMATAQRMLLVFRRPPGG